MKSLLALHRMAAERGDGLLPALVGLLERADSADSVCVSSVLVRNEDRPIARPSPTLIRAKNTR